MDLEKLAAAITQNANINNVNFNDIHDNHIVNVGADGSVSNQTSKDIPTVVKRLRPLFKNDLQEATNFYDSIQVMKPTDITLFVNQLVEQGIILRDYRKKPLFDILKENGLYEPTLQNWNEQII